jgi:hypothetical protein
VKKSKLEKTNYLVKQEDHIDDYIDAIDIIYNEKFKFI